MRTYEAIQQGNEADVAALLDVDPTQLEALNRAYGYTSLIWAAKHGQLGVVRLLVQRGANVHAAMDHGYTALHYGAGWGHEDMVAFLLTKGVEVRTRDTQGRTPLMDASRRGHVGVVRLLVPHLGRGGLDDRDGSGRTALHEAATGGHREVVEVLLSHGVQANSTDVSGVSVLMEACEKGHLGVVQMLLTHTGTHDNLLHYGGPTAGLEQRDGEGRTVLSHAAAGGDVGVVSLLLKHGAQIGVTDSCGRTPFMWACEGGRLAVVRLLHGCLGVQALGQRDVCGKTALHHAAGGWKAEEVVRFLLLERTEPSLTDRDGVTPREVAEEEGHHECLAVFEHWKDAFKSHMLYRARWLHNASLQHAHDPSASAALAAVLRARVAAGVELPGVQMLRGLGQEEGEMVGFVVTRAPREIFKEIMTMLPAPKG